MKIIRLLLVISVLLVLFSCKAPKDEYERLAKEISVIDQNIAKLEEAYNKELLEKQRIENLRGKYVIGDFANSIVSMQTNSSSQNITSFIFGTWVSNEMILDIIEEEHKAIFIRFCDNQIIEVKEIEYTISDNVIEFCDAGMCQSYQYVVSAETLFLDGDINYSFYLLTPDSDEKYPW